MQKILVTTDFSEHSNAGIYFAIQLASQNNAAIHFFHVFHTPANSAWDVLKKDAADLEHTEWAQTKLRQYVTDIYHELDITAPGFDCVTKVSVYPEATIREYAAENNFDFICISTRGAGGINKIFGTTTGNLINHSDTPVIAVPFSYKPSEIVRVLYSSDLEHVENELETVLTFTQPIGATLELLHFVTPSTKHLNTEHVQQAIRKFPRHTIETNIPDADLTKPIIQNIELAIQKNKPSMIVMFTQQNRSLFQRVFLSSKSEEYSFKVTIPLLVYQKS